MAYDRNRQSDSCGIVAAILLVLLLGFVGAAVVSVFYLKASRSRHELVIVRDEAVRARMMAERAQADTELAKVSDEPLAEAVPDNSDFIDVQQINITLDEEGNASFDGNSMQLGELANELRRMKAELNGQLSVAVQVDEQCRFEHVARILSLCEECGIESPRFTAR